MKAKEVEKILIKNGWYADRQNGSHRIFKHDEKENSVSLPMQKGDVPIGLLKQIERKSGLRFI